MNKLLDTYYNILEVNKTASVSEIKSAYRKRAKELHPDRNKSADAHEKFILLTEAYSFLLNFKRVGSSTRRSPISSKEWEKVKREKARKQARKFAQMRYEQFVKSEEYKFSNLLDLVTNHLALFFTVFLIIVLPVVATTVYGSSGFWGSLVIVFISLPVTIPAIRYIKYLNLNKFAKSLVYVIKTPEFLMFSIGLANIIIILEVGFQTLIPLETFILLMLGVCSIFYLGTKFIFRIKSKYVVAFYSFFLGPLLLNLFFLLNFGFSKNPISESYSFRQEKQRTKRGWQNSSFIKLENDKYSNYPGIRTFWDYEPLEHSKKVTYTFENGLFGIRVLTDYSLE